ncbi:hypothetical protein KBY93_14990 [Synechococcus sp. J7-Johnson]|uniref:hypothetical protein n=1 Tax=Synechococcus sp. J7-Johnson TaxID=2823737 RepID=UPI0020CE18FE|nr:hypothetical protein [Synechococcus sp. J7-Johnson]MCP9841920.1 hypothetical protein [Synechococcus sp. J7-Johnson]
MDCPPLRSVGIGDLLEVLSGDPPARNNCHRIDLMEGDAVRLLNTSKKRDWRPV